MKKVLLFTLALVFAMAGMAQNRAIFLQESFDGNTLPSGWTVDGQTSNWSVSATNNAGGSANEMKLDWSPQFNGMTRLVTPALDLTGVNSVIFSFKHALDNYQGTNTIGIATSSDGGTTWNTAWSQGYATSSSWAVSQEISTADMGQASVKFCIYFNGSSYNINDWYFDDITIFTLENLDLGLESSTMPSFVGAGDLPLGITVFNYGSTTVTSVEATYQVEGEAPVTETFSVNIPSLNTETLDFVTIPSFIPGSYVVNFSIDKVNGVDDDVVDNNTYSTEISVAITAVEKIPMIEHFSSSTCGPCVSVNTTMLNFCNTNVGRFTYTKYQMNWPGNGDPYYTAEGGTRRNFYGVSAVPQCFLDGEDQGYAAVQQSVFNEHAGKAAFMDVRGSFSVVGNTISVKADVMPYIDINARVFVSVNEKETHNNVGSNGETSFHHIFMKMLTNVNGDQYNFNACEVQHMEFSQDLSGTHVEEMSDLEVSIWVQVYTSHEVLNSRFAYEYTDEHPYPVQNLTMTQSKDYTMTVSWDAPEDGTPTGYDVYLNGILNAENITEREFSFISADGSYDVVGVVAKYADDKTSVMSVVDTPEAPQDLGLVPNMTSVTLDPTTPSVELYVTNSNNVSQTPIVLNSVEEVNDEGRQYLTITCDALPITLNYNEDFTIILETNTEGAAKGMAETTVVLSSEIGDVTFVVQVDGELLSVTELSAETKIYPNPTSSIFTVEGVNVAKVEVYNLVGQKVYEQQGKVVRIDAANWDKGLYLVNILDQNGSVETRKLMVK